MQDTLSRTDFLHILYAKWFDNLLGNSQQISRCPWVQPLCRGVIMRKINHIDRKTIFPHFSGSEDYLWHCSKAKEWNLTTMITCWLSPNNVDANLLVCVCVWVSFRRLCRAENVIHSLELFAFQVLFTF